MTHSLVAIAFAVVCVAIGLRSSDRTAGQLTFGLLIATILVVAAEAAVGLTK